MTDSWQLQEAKSKFSQLVERTLTHGAQIITRRGKRAVVIIPFDEYERLTRPTHNMVQFLVESPFSGSELDTERDQSLPKEIDIEP